jgi:hypothetical protein
VTAPGYRQPVGFLINPIGESILAAAEAAIDAVVEQGLFVPIGKENHHFRVRVANVAQLNRFLHTGPRPPRFPAGVRSRLLARWRSRKQGAKIEVTEFMTIVALRAVGDDVG